MMGVLNYAPDSFSDGGRCNAACLHTCLSPCRYTSPSVLINFDPGSYTSGCLQMMGSYNSGCLLWLSLDNGLMYLRLSPGNGRAELHARFLLRRGALQRRMLEPLYVLVDTSLCHFRYVNKDRERYMIKDMYINGLSVRTERGIWTDSLSV